MKTTPCRYPKLQPEDRLSMASLLQQCHSLRDIALVLQRSYSTIRRESYLNAMQAPLEGTPVPDMRYISVTAKHRCQHRRRDGRAQHKCSNENINGLVRQYLPKGTDLSGYSQEPLDAIADEINNRPRKGLGVRSPLAIYT